MTARERDELVREIARRVFAEESTGRPVDAERLAWAADVLDRRRAGEVPASQRQGEWA